MSICELSSPSIASGTEEFALDLPTARGVRRNFESVNSCHRLEPPSFFEPRAARVCVTDEGNAEGHAGRAISRIKACWTGQRADER
jgi:hypothetical protein